MAKSYVWRQDLVELFLSIAAELVEWVLYVLRENPDAVVILCGAVRAVRAELWPDVPPA